MKDFFPIFKNRPGLVYLDSVASALKPQKVIEAHAGYYTEYSANVARGIYAISERATDAYERVRVLSARFIGASSPDEIVFTRNATESLNLLASTLTNNLSPGDEIVVTEMEHHANFVPWQQLALQKHLNFVVIPFDTNGKIKPETLKRYITEKTKIFAFVHASNVLGTINPAKTLVQMAQSLNPEIITIIDGAQSVPHFRVDVSDIGCDFFVFSSHKIFGPTGAGVLWGKCEQLEKLPPFLYGGEMVEFVSREKTTFKPIPHRFEAGTPAIGEVIGMGCAIEFIEEIGYEQIAKHEEALAKYAYDALTGAFGEHIHILGPRELENRVPLFSFTIDGIHPHDIAQILAQDDICIRAGSHCAMPLHTAMKLDSPATARISISIYNTEEDIDACIRSLKKAFETFNRY